MSAGQAGRTAVFSRHDAEHLSAAAPVTSLGALLAAADSGSSEAFYGALCKGMCETAELSRAVALVEQPDGAFVVAGTWGVASTSPMGAELVPGPRCPIVRALRRDAVMEGRWPESCEVLTRAFGHSRLIAVPMVAGGRSLGALVGDRRSAPLCPSPQDRRALWTFGKTAAVAVAARAAAQRDADERRLADATALGRRLHDAVTQRLFGVSAVLESAEELSPPDRALLAGELQAARQALAGAVEDALAGAPDPRSTAAPPDVAALCAVVLEEALRNVAKHANATRIAVTLHVEDGEARLEVHNDGRLTPARAAGLGLRLADLEAARQGASLEWGPEGADGWAVRVRTRDGLR